MITERTLKRWRGDALELNSKVNVETILVKDSVSIGSFVTLNDRILRLTQELLDQHLLRRKSQ